MTLYTAFHFFLEYGLDTLFFSSYYSSSLLSLVFYATETETSPLLFAVDSMVMSSSSSLYH